MPGKKQVVFVSDKNACRSIIAQAYALKFGFDYMDAHSFGINPDRVHYLVYEVLQSKGFNMTFYFSKAYEVVEHQTFDMVIVLNPSITSQLPKLPYEYDLLEWNFEDPTVNKNSEEKMREEIEALCKKIENEVQVLIKRLTN